MVNKFIYLIILLLVLSACETAYIADLEKVDDIMVVEAHLLAGEAQQMVQLHWSRGFYENENIKPVTDAVVQITDDLDNNFPCIEYPDGVYVASFKLDPGRQYKLQISENGDRYESEFEGVPAQPAIDTLYSEEYEKVVQVGGETSVDNFFKILGHQFYVDINNNATAQYYRFYARKILQYYFPFDTVINGVSIKEYKYAWKSIYPNGTFNIARPADYSSSENIYKHPVEFFNYTEEAYLDTGKVGFGWIYIIHEYEINKSTYQFYADLNSQLEANGKIFDPLYTQSRGNLKCISDKSKGILGNFEVASYRQYRYYLRLEKNADQQYVRKMEHFYDIPERGIKPLKPPYFWER